ncbi:hypothetical protein C8Q76DRAFT_622201 [Earliella scabrosa]|nr:hypothetical protein C8Q76DRAFT_622201 [Earliella scabrosa]
MNCGCTAFEGRRGVTDKCSTRVLVYPFTGTGAVNVTRGDLKRLDAGQYLNDTIIEFGLKLWLDDLRKERPDLAEQVHVFNSFFYKKLVSKRKCVSCFS